MIRSQIDFGINLPQCLQWGPKKRGGEVDPKLGRALTSCTVLTRKSTAARFPMALSRSENPSLLLSTVSSGDFDSSASASVRKGVSMLFDREGLNNAFTGLNTWSSAFRCGGDCEVVKVVI